MELKNSVPHHTALYDEHKKLNAKMIDFHGWEMPLEYTGIIKEHMAVRKNVGMFDISHMGDIVIEGKDAGKYVDYIFPSLVSELENNQCMYTAFLNNSGNIIDDTIIDRINENKFFLIPNASNIEKMFRWMEENKSNFDVNIYNYSDKISHIAVQGPSSPEVLKRLGIEFPETFKFIYYKTDKFNVITGENNIIVSGTGYTGEKGVELIVPNESAACLWNKILGIIKDIDGLPCGLGARDTLRMEKGMLLSGQDFNEDRNPYEASISFIINYNHEFIGKSELMKKKDNFEYIFRGFILNNKNIPRNGFEVFVDNSSIGKITSGSISPILNQGIGLGYINKKYRNYNNDVFIKIREKMVPAKISKPRIIK